LGRWLHGRIQERRRVLRQDEQRWLLQLISRMLLDLQLLLLVLLNLQQIFPDKQRGTFKLRMV
jgi:hypothetical protein